MSFFVCKNKKNIVTLHSKKKKIIFFYPNDDFYH